MECSKMSWSSMPSGAGGDGIRHAARGGDGIRHAARGGDGKQEGDCAGNESLSLLLWRMSRRLRPELEGGATIAATGVGGGGTGDAMEME